MPPRIQGKGLQNIGFWYCASQDFEMESVWSYVICNKEIGYILITSRKVQEHIFLCKVQSCHKKWFLWLIQTLSSGWCMVQKITRENKLQSMPVSQQEVKAKVQHTLPTRGGSEWVHVLACQPVALLQTIYSISSSCPLNAERHFWFTKSTYHGQIRQNRVDT